MGPRGFRGRKLMLLACTTLAASSAIGISTPVHAQTARPASQAAGGSGTAVQEVIVTARRREESLKDVPVAEQAISGELVANRNIVTQEDLSKYTPNFTVSNGSIGAYRIVRGVGSASNFSFETAVGSFVDQVYMGRPNLARMPFYDVERVEVLRGPQTILFGISTTSGALSTTTRKPGREWGGDIKASYEFNNRELIVQGGIDIPLGDKAAIRIAAITQQLDKGWVKVYDGPRQYNDPRYDNRGVRVTGVFEPIDDLRITLKYEKDDILYDGNIQEPITNPTNFSQIVDALPNRVKYVGQPPPAGRGDNLGIPGDASWMRLYPEVVTGTIEGKIGDFNVTSTTGYVDFVFHHQFENDFTPFPSQNSSYNEKYSMFSQEFRVDGTIADVVDLNAGVYYQRDSDFGDRQSDLNSQYNSNLTAGSIGSYLSFNQKTQNYSVFADATWRATERLRVGLGARYAWIKKSVDQSIISTTAFTWIPTPSIGQTAPWRASYGNPHAYTDVKTDNEFFMPQGLVQYDLNDDTMLYAKVVKGAKAGGFDYAYVERNAVLGPAGGIFQPEKALSYEAGMKSYLFDRRVSLDVAIFRTDFENLQVQIFNGVGFVVGNAAELRSQGVEVDTTWRITPATTFNLFAAYLDAKYRDYDAACHYAQRVVKPVGCTQDLSGQMPQFASKWSFTGGLEHDFEAGDLRISPRIDVTYRSEFNTAANNDPIAQQPGFALVDLRLKAGVMDKPWSITAFAKNLTNEYFLEFTSDTLNQPGVRAGAFSRGRQLGVQFDTTF